MAPVVEPGGADVGVAEPLLDAGDVGLVLKGIGRRGSAKAVYPEAGDCNAGRAGVGADYGIDAVSGEPGAGAAQDRLWQESFDIIIVPHPELSAGQQAVVAKDYNMVDGRAVLTVRYAMLFYVLKRLGLLEEARLRDPRTQHIVAADEQEVAAALERAQHEFDDADMASGVTPR